MSMAEHWKSWREKTGPAATVALDQAWNGHLSAPEDPAYWWARCLRHNRPPWALDHPFFWVRLQQQEGRLPLVPLPMVGIYDLHVGETPITIEQYRMFCRPPAPFTSAIWEDPAFRADPMTELLPSDVEGYVQWLNFAYGYAAETGFRLPTSAEWYSWVTAWTPTWQLSVATLLAHGWFLANASGKPHAVRTKEPSPHGLYDLLGNVDGLCTDKEMGYMWCGGNYRSSPFAFDNEGGRVSVSRYYRREVDPNHRYPTGGFRVVCSVEAV